MPCIVKVHIERARNLTSKPEAYVEIRLNGLEPQRTLVHRASSNPVWDHDMRFEVSDDRLLQDGPLELRALDSASGELLGFLMLDLNPLMAADSPYVLNGWFPLFDSVRRAGVGEVFLQARFQFFGDSNPFKESSAGVQFFVSDTWTKDLGQTRLIGLVDCELGAPDPEFEWSESFRSARASNLTSTRVFYELSGRLRRQLGKKVLEMGGNAILGFRQWVNLEPAAKRITIRGLGTACKAHCDGEDILNVEEEEEGVQLLTVGTLPPGKVISATGGVVASRAVKLFNARSKHTTSSAVEDLDHWLNDVREECKSHAKLLNCTHVIGYTEQVTIWGELYILTAMGTAVCLADEAKVTCSFGHISYKRHQAPFSVDFSLCRSCRKKHVPQVILSTANAPEKFHFQKNIHAAVSRLISPKAKHHPSHDKESLALGIGAALPFVEYDLHRQLVYQLRILGCNVVCNLRHHSLQIQQDSMGTKIIALATGEAGVLCSLPLPPILKISRSAKVVDEEDRMLVNVQHELTDLSISNHQAHESLVILELGPEALESDSEQSSSSSSSSEEDEIAEGAGLDDSRSTTSSSSSSSDEDVDALAVMQIDDEADEELVRMLSLPPESTGKVMKMEQPLDFQVSSELHSSLDLVKALGRLPHNCIITPIVTDGQLVIAQAINNSDKSLVVEEDDDEGEEENYGAVTFHFVKELKDQSGLLRMIWEEDVRPMVEGFVKGIGAERYGPVSIVHVSKVEESSDGTCRIIVSLCVDILHKDD